MSDPPRLLQQPGTKASTLELLRALEPPSAPPPAVHGALVKDISGMVGGSAVKVGAAVWLKASFVALVALGVGGVVYWSSADRAAVRAPVAVSPRLVSPPAAPLASEAPPAVVPDVMAVPSVTPPERAKMVGSAPPRDPLAAEEALLEAARQELAQSPARALSLLQRHKMQFPSGQLSAERLYLSVDCLQRLGNTAAAQREAAALAKHYPNSAYARRAPLLLASPKRP